MTVTRSLPLSGDGATILARNKEEIEALWQVASCPLTGVTGLDTITASALYALPANAEGVKVSFRPQGANVTTTPTLNVNGRGALAIRDAAGGVLPANYFSAARLEQAINSAGEWRLLGSSGAGGVQFKKSRIALQRASGVNGGTMVGGSVRTRYPLNTILQNDHGIFLDTTTNIGRMAVPAGTYARISAMGVFYLTAACGIYLRNISAGADVPGTARMSAWGNSPASLETSVTFASAQTLEMQYANVAAQNTFGLGVAVTDGGGAPEQYGYIIFESFT